MSILYAIVVLVVFGAWLYLELRQRKPVRLVLGLCCLGLILAGWLLASYQAGFEESHEWAHLNASLERLEQLLAEGEISSAEAAISAYNATLQSTGDPYEASVVLWQSIPLSESKE